LIHRATGLTPHARPTEGTSARQRTIASRIFAFKISGSGKNSSLRRIYTIEMNNRWMPKDADVIKKDYDRAVRLREQHDELSVLSNLPVPVSALIAAEDGVYTVLHVGALTHEDFRVITGEMLASLNWLGCSKSLTSPAGISWLPGSSGPSGSDCARLLYLNPSPNFKPISEKPPR
jgi:hypothetical protein